MMRDDLLADPPVFFLPRGRAMVVDQNRKDLQSYAAILRRLGFEVKAFTNSHDALNCLGERPVDFVFVNQGSTAFEWQEIVKAVLARDRRTPVVVLTRSLDVSCYLEAIHLGATDYVEKPLASSQLEHLVTTYSPSPLLKMHQSA